MLLCCYIHKAWRCFVWLWSEGLRIPGGRNFGMFYTLHGQFKLRQFIGDVGFVTLHKDRNSSWRARRSRAARPLMRANRQHATQRFDASPRGFYIRRGLVQTRLELELFCRSTETNGLWLSCIPHDTLCRRQEHRQGGFIEALKAGNVRKADPQGPRRRGLSVARAMTTKSLAFAGVFRFSSLIRLAP